jgi:hypothetical protein
MSSWFVGLRLEKSEVGRGGIGEGGIGEGEKAKRYRFEAGCGEEERKEQ